MPNDQNPLSQDPTQTPQPLPAKPTDEPTLEEVAAQMKAANASVAEVLPVTETAPPVLTSSNEIPSSQPPTPTTPTIPTPIPTPEPIAANPVTPPVAQDAIGQLDSLPDTPVSTQNLGQKIAQSLADSEVIGEQQVGDVADALTPELIQEIANGGNDSASIPIDITNADGTKLQIEVPTKDFFDFLAGHTNRITVSK